MNTFNSTFMGTFRQYAGKLRTIRDEVRTQRFLNSLPNEVRKDIGWPDRYPELRGRLR